MNNETGVASIIFFKETGKYYANEVYKGFDISKPPWQIFENIKFFYKNKYQYMHMVVLFDDSYSKGYPFMQPASERY